MMTSAHRENSEIVRKITLRGVNCLFLLWCLKQHQVECSTEHTIIIIIQYYNNNKWWDQYGSILLWKKWRTVLFTNTGTDMHTWRTGGRYFTQLAKSRNKQVQVLKRQLYSVSMWYLFPVHPALPASEEH